MDFLCSMCQSVELWMSIWMLSSKALPLALALLLLLSLKFLDCLCYFTTIAGSNPGSWAIVESHCLYSTFCRMCLDPNRANFCNSVTLMFPGILSICFSVPFLTTPSAPMTTGPSFRWKTAFNPSNDFRDSKLYVATGCNFSVYLICFDQSQNVVVLFF